MDLCAFLLGASNSLTWSLSLPNNPALVGVQFNTQFLALDPPANASGLVCSSAALVTIGT